jgi:hypothetical protein
LTEETALTKASGRSVNSLRTTVPIFVVKLFDLKIGDKLRWRIEVQKGSMALKVEPVKQEKHGDKTGRASP